MLRLLHLLLCLLLAMTKAKASATASLRDSTCGIVTIYNNANRAFYFLSLRDSALAESWQSIIKQKSNSTIES
ncbi:hypothetical protein [Helicobacter rodentium]|uniref:hypothetical protein n=2 Tax=Helicobacter rodentium TaxID=59617 RepID=UPI0023F05F8A|nr:hypothetical protein [Helicobacter rodentium]